MMFADLQYFFAYSLGEAVIVVGAALVAVCVIMALLISTVWAVRTLKI